MTTEPADHSTHHRHCGRKTPAEFLIEKGLEGRDPPGTPRDYHTEVEALKKSRDQWRNGVFISRQRLLLEEARLRDLQAENETHRSIKQPPRAPRDPSLDAPERKWSQVPEGDLPLP